MDGVIVERVERPSPEVVAGFEGVGTTELSDVVEEHNAMDAGIGAVTEARRLCGTAITVRLRNEHNVMVHVAYDLARPGDVIVIETDGARRASWGDTYVNRTGGKDLAGGVIDGYVRDVDGFDEVGFPVFCRGTTPRAPLNPGDDVPGSVNLPVTVGGVRVHPGDVVVGDGDGVAIVPRDRAEAVLEAARDSLAALAETRSRMNDGASILDLRSIDEALERTGIERIEGPVDHRRDPAG